jgi:hypothetical protein
MPLTIFNGSPIFFLNTDFKLNQEEEKIILKLKYRKDKFLDEPNVSEEMSLFTNKKLKRIKDIIFNYVEEYKNNILQINDQLRLVHSWATVNDNTNHRCHAHKNSLISCSFYLKSEGDNKIIFKKEKTILQKCHYLDYTIKEYNSFNSETWSFDTKQGSIIIFLSDLYHESINKGNKIMVGANYFVTGKIGTKKEYTYFEI